MFGKKREGFYPNDLKDFYNLVKKGDILEFPRVGFSHYGVYIGTHNEVEHCVVHLTIPIHQADDSVLAEIRRYVRSVTLGTSNLNGAGLAIALRKSSGKNIGGVQIDPVRVVCKDGRVLISNKREFLYKADKPHKIVERALARFKNRDKESSYNIFVNNCEHLAYSIRYNCHRSLQAEDFFSSLFRKIFGILFGILITHSVEMIVKTHRSMGEGGYSPVDSLQCYVVMLNLTMIAVQVLAGIFYLLEAEIILWRIQTDLVIRFFGKLIWECYSFVQIILHPVKI